VREWVARRVPWGKVEHAEQLIAMSLVFLVHVLGAVALVWAMLDDRGWRGLKDWWPRDDGPSDDPRDDDRPTPGGGRVDLPLPSATPSPVRLREPGRIGDATARPARRPEHEPERLPVRRR
jgi:hypothetical protein